MNTIATPDRFTTLPDEQTLASAVTALTQAQEMKAIGRIHIVLIRQAVGF